MNGGIALAATWGPQPRGDTKSGINRNLVHLSQAANLS
jgi:hypothetical protein